MHFSVHFKTLANLRIDERATSIASQCVCLLFCLVAVQCTGCADGSVGASGIVTIEGEPATGGQLTLVPLGDGTRAQSGITEKGEFSFRSSELSGVMPGEYRVAMIQKIENSKLKSVAASGRLGNPNDLQVIYTGPKDRPLTIPKTGSENLQININQADGWTWQMSE